MTETISCESVREASYDYRRGEVSEELRLLIGEHLSGCASCHSFVDRLTAMLESASRGTFLALDSAAKDELFQRIEVALPKPSDAGVVPVWAGIDRSDADPDRPELRCELGPGTPRRWGRGRRLALAALAAAVLVAASWGSWFLSHVHQRDTSSISSTAISESPTEDSERVGPAEGTDDQTSNSMAVASTPDWPTQMASTARPYTGVTVVASADAQWSFSDDIDLVIDCRQGLLLIEFLPKNDRRLVVRTPATRVEVTGTVFYVSSAGATGAVGVLSGSVRVNNDTGANVNLESGTELRADGSIGAIPRARTDFVARHLDLEAHRRAIAALRRQAPEPEGHDMEVVPPVAVQGVSRPESRSARREREETEAPQGPGPFELAELAQREGRFHDAAGILEALVAERDPTDAEAGSAHLELARLYWRRLDEPRQAVRHLRLFLAQHADDAAAESVHEELCRLLQELGERDPNCSDERDD